MTSEQAMRTTVLLLCMLVMGGCQGPEPITSPYPTKHTWAIAPLRNESGSLSANGFEVADTLAQRLETVSGLHVLPVNRTIKSMQAMDIQEITSPSQARELLKTLGADGLVVGSITAFEPYDPPKIGIAIELYVNPKVDRSDSINVRRLIRAATDRPAGNKSSNLRQPVSIISGFFDAADPDVHEQLKHYAIQHRRVTEKSWRVYRISMDLYTEFVTDLMSRWLMQAEAQRIRPTKLTSP